MDEDETDDGWSWAAIEGIVLETSEWTWGTVQGAFNEKATLSQIIVDAVSNPRFQTRCRRQRNHRGSQSHRLWQCRAVAPKHFGA